MLVVEDEADVASFVTQALKQQGYEVSLATDGNSGLEQMLSNEFDLVVLDVALPGMDGFEVLRHARQKVKTPVLMLTARRRLVDRVEGLESGADDYLVKPFELQEFLARVKAIIRRSQVAKGVIEVGDLWLDLMSRRAKRAGRTIYFSNTEFALIELLASRAGDTVSKKEILQKVWDEDDYRDPNLVEVYIGYLRNKLEQAGMARMIHTVRGVGYRLEEA
ncbi:MAG TPA: response regulator transcription factor [Fimbriimonadaceae bacterium]|nr:response regulator transcription factor [Fimbriimonadaceae bacterium]